MRLLLIYPSAETSGLSQQLVMVEPLALEYLAAAVTEEHDVRILDLRVSEYGLNEALMYWKPDVVGITGFTFHVPEMLLLADGVKAISQDIKVIVGGHHATFLPQTFMLPNIDVIARWECEGIMSRLLNSVHSAHKLAKVPGLIYQRNGDWVGSGVRPTSIFPKLIPARYLVREHAHQYHMLQINCSTMQMSRGCPYSCTFCDAHKFFQGKYQSRDAAMVVEEIASLSASLVFIADDNIGIGINYLRDVLQRLAYTNIKKRYFITVGAKEVLRNKWLFDSWFELGLKIIFTGMERVEDEAIAHLGKRTTVNMNDEVIDYVHARHGIVVGSFIVLPTDTEDDFKRLEEYVLSREVDMPMFCILTPFPGTDIWKEYEEKLDRNFSKYDFMHVIIPTSLPEVEFYFHFHHLYTMVNLRRLVWKMVRSMGLGGWLFRLPRVANELKGVTGESA